MSEVKTLRDLRLSTGLKQRELAEIMGLSQKTIYNAERDSSKLSSRNLDKYIHVFNIDYKNIHRGKPDELIAANRAAVIERAKSLKKIENS